MSIYKIKPLEWRTQTLTLNEPAHPNQISETIIGQYQISFRENIFHLHFFGEQTWLIITATTEHEIKELAQLDYIDMLEDELIKI